MATSAIAMRMARRRERRHTSLWPYAVLLVLGAAVLLPLIFLVVGSFSTARIPTNIAWKNLGLANYVAVWLIRKPTACFSIRSSLWSVQRRSELHWRQYSLGWSSARMFREKPGSTPGFR